MRSVKRCDGGCKGVAYEAVIDATRVREETGDDALCILLSRRLFVIDLKRDCLNSG